MGKLVYRDKQYIVTESRRGHVIMNIDGCFSENHGHIKRLSTCKMLIGLIHKNIVPDSSYLRETCMRICLDEKYKNQIRNKMAKDNNKQKYFNPNKGVVRK